MIGSCLIEQLLLNPENTVFAIDDFSIGKNRQECDRLIWCKKSILNDDVIVQIKKFNPTILVHCAAHPGGKSLQQPILNVETNAFGSMRLFSFCADNNVELIYLSSSVVYGEQPNLPISEDAVLTPGTIYGVNKVACEQYLKILQQGFNLKWTALRLFATYGHGHTPNKHQGIVNIMLSQLMEGDTVIVKGALKRSRDMVYVADVVAAIVMAIDNKKARGEIINIGTGVSVSIGELIYLIASLLGKRKEQIQLIEQQGTVGDVFYNSADCTKAKNILGFEPRVSLNQGLEKFIMARQKQTDTVAD